MANSLSILEASIARVLSLLSKNHPELTDEITRLKKADEYSKKMITTLRDFRDHVHGMQKDQKTDS